MIVLTLFAVLGGVLIMGVGGARRKAAGVSRREQCADNLRRLGEGAILYRARYGAFPQATGARFWRTLYLDPIPVAKNPRLYACPATKDSLLDEKGRSRWLLAEDPTGLWKTFRPPVPSDSCSYAGPRALLTGDIDWADGAMGADDNEPSDVPNHQGGLNLLRPDGRVQWLEGVSWPVLFDIGGANGWRSHGLELLEN